MYKVKLLPSLQECGAGTLRIALRAYYTAQGSDIKLGVTY